MISWLQNILQKHYKWLFSILLGVIIVAFVFTIGASPGIGGGKRQNNKPMLYFGYDLGNKEDLEILFKKSNISNILNTGKPVQNPLIAERMALIRPPLIDLANIVQVPVPNEYQLVDFIKSKPFFASEGNFDTIKYQDFLAQLQENSSLTQGEVRETLSEDYRIEKIIRLLSGPAFVLPFEAKLILERQKTLWSIHVAELNARSILLENDKINDSDIKDYFEKHKLSYTIPQKIQVSYLLFPSSQYLKEVQEPSAEALEQFYQENTSLFTDKDNKILPFETVPKTTLQDKYVQDQAKILATEAANNFAYQLYENQIKNDSPAFKELLAKSKATLKEMKPFSKESIPNDGALSGRFLERAFLLNEENYFSEVSTFNKGAVILVYKQMIPPTLPTLDSIEDKLKEKFLEEKNLKLLKEKGQKLKQMYFAQAIKEAKEFDRMATQNGFSIKVYDRFTLLDAPKDLDPFLLPELLTLHEGAVSELILRDDKGLLVFVSKKEVPEIKIDGKEVEAQIEQTTQNLSYVSAQAIISELINTKIKSFSDKP